MESFSSIVADAVTAHENGSYRAGATAAADCVVKAVEKYGKWVVLAAGELIKAYPSDVEDVPADRIEDFLQEHYLHTGATVSTSLESYAQADGESGVRSGLGRLFNELDRQGGVSFFDWGGYADSGTTPVSGLRFIVMPVPAGEAGTFIFGT